MVFSNICYSRKYGTGTGWILPVRAAINSFDDLKAEARQLGRAEGFEDGLSKSWGAIGLLLHPRREKTFEIRFSYVQRLC